MLEVEKKREKNITKKSNQIMKAKTIKKKKEKHKSFK